MLAKKIGDQDTEILSLDGAHVWALGAKTIVPFSGVDEPSTPAQQRSARKDILVHLGHSLFLCAIDSLSSGHPQRARALGSGVEPAWVSGGIRKRGCTRALVQLRVQEEKLK